MQPVDVLKRYWGHEAFRPGQAEIIDSVLSGRDTIGLLPTGGGKSITFQVPAMLLPGITIVITPLISLMKDQVDHLHRAHIPAGLLHSGMHPGEIRTTLDRCQYGRTKLLYMSPERLARPTFLNELRHWDISLIVVDEAHCISQWGYDFRPSYLEINRLRKMFPKVPVLAVTASATPEVVTDIARNLEMDSPALFSRSFSRENLSYVIRRDDNKIERLATVMLNTQGPAIVYVRSRKRCSELCKALRDRGFTAEFYHAGLNKDEKTRRQDQWVADEVRIMVATNAFGMGIDKPDVRTVVHYDIPSSLEEYYQEAGRAGRDGLPAYAIMLVSSHDGGVLTRRISESFPEREFICRVYDCLGVWFNLAIGDGFEKAFEFDIQLFCHRFELPVARVQAAITLLERAGYIEHADDTWSGARLMILQNRRDLYDLKVDAKTDRVLQGILRLYTGLFADFVEISESYIASCTDTTPEQVYIALQSLSKMQVLSYIPRRLHPYIFYCKRREEGRHILIPRTIYEDQRERLERRVEAVRKFAFSKDTCRNDIILEYFGQKPEGGCGRCDVCRSRRASVRQWPDLATEILNHLRSCPDGCTMEQFTTTDMAYNRRIADTLQRLIHEGLISLDKSLLKAV